MVCVLSLGYEGILVGKLDYANMEFDFLVLFSAGVMCIYEIH
jgi:hypothetical protein